MKGALLDLNGTLIDGNEARARAWLEALADAGVPAEYEVIREKLGEGDALLLPAVTGIMPASELGSRILERRAEIFHLDYLPWLKLFSGARALLDMLRGNGVRTVIVSAAFPGDVDLLVDRFGLREALSGPPCESVRAGLRRLGMGGREVSVLAGNPQCVREARDSGASAIAFTCGGWPADAFAGADAVYDGPWDMVVDLFAARNLAA